MNRQQRRSLERRLRTTKDTDALRRLIEDAAHNTENPINDGDTVKINVERIRSRKEWERLQSEYRDFVEQNADKEFVARLRHSSEAGYPVIFDLDGCNWSFWEGDLIKTGAQE